MREALEAGSEKIGSKFNTVILNAGIGDVGPTLTQTPQSLIEKITRINQWGVLYGLKHAPEFMHDNGSIIATSSMASILSMPGTGVYSAAKAAVNSMVSMAALELGARGIRVNSICPGYVNTALGNSQEELRISEVMTALGRHADPKDDIAGVFLFLASNASRYMSGQALQVDGGWRCGPTYELLRAVTGSDNAPGS
jgi:NAD(P)-dependent dehydrogenase (short-subunit alcohol dehydrogenase family)